MGIFVDKFFVCMYCDFRYFNKYFLTFFCVRDYVLGCVVNRIGKMLLFFLN